MEEIRHCTFTKLSHNDIISEELFSHYLAVNSLFYVESIEWRPTNAVKAKIWIITTFEKMLQIANLVMNERTAELEHCDIQVSSSHTDILGFQNSLVELRKAQEWGAEVIVSRGGTAAYIAENTEIPVVEIQVTALDILQAVQKTGLAPSLIGIAGSHNITYECESLYDFLGIKLRQISISDDNDYVGSGWNRQPRRGCGGHQVCPLGRHVGGSHRVRKSIHLQGDQGGGSARQSTQKRAVPGRTSQNRHRRFHRRHCSY